MKLKFLKFIDKCVGYWLQVNKSQSKQKNRPNSSTIKTIAVIKQSAMGDALCLMPALRLIKQWHPESKLIWVTTHKSNPSLFADLDFIDEIIIIPTSLKIVRALFHWEKLSIDFCIDADQYYQSSQWLALQSHYAHGFTTPTKPTRLNSHHQYDLKDNEKRQFLQLITSAFQQKIPEDFNYQLCELIDNHKISDALERLIEKVDKEKNNGKVIIVYPGSGLNASFRRWHCSKFVAVSQTLLEQQHSIIIAGGKDEVSLSTRFDLITNKYERCHNLIDQLSIKDWLWFMKNHAQLFIGNDAGLLHIAEASGIAILGIFGPNIGSKWGSLNTLSEYIETPKNQLSCRPCIRTAEGIIPQTCARGDLACLDWINDKTVSHTALKMLSDKAT